jgi:hypothetical protein
VVKAFVLGGRFHMLTSTGIVHYLVKNASGVKYRHHAGTAIAGGALFGEKTDLELSRPDGIHVRTRGASDSSKIRFAVEVDAGASRTLSSEDYSTSAVAKPKVWNKSGYGHLVGFGFRSAASAVTVVAVSFDGASSGARS